jgi:hypothetical protein
MRVDYRQHSYEAQKARKLNAQKAGWIAVGVGFAYPAILKPPPAERQQKCVLALALTRPLASPGDKGVDQVELIQLVALQRRSRMSAHCCDESSWPGKHQAPSRHR